MIMIKDLNLCIRDVEILDNFQCGFVNMKSKQSNNLVNGGQNYDFFEAAI